MTLTVLDDASDDETKNLLVRLQKDIPFALYRNETSAGTGIARNQVIKLSETHWGRGDYLYLSDNDVWFHNSMWLDVLIHCYEEAWKYDFMVIGAYNHPFHHPIDREQWVWVEQFSVKPVYALALQSMLMRWEVWDKYGPFDTTPVGRVRMSEDVAFTNKLRDDGGRVGVISPPLLANTGISDSFGEKIPGWEIVQQQAPKGVIVE